MKEHKISNELQTFLKTEFNKHKNFERIVIPISEQNALIRELTKWYITTFYYYDNYVIINGKRTIIISRKKLFDVQKYEFTFEIIKHWSNWFII